MLESALIQKYKVAENAWAFVFERPEKFIFQAGQAMDLTLPITEAVNGPTRTFSIASAPSDSHLTIVTRHKESSTFKKYLWCMPIGSKVMIEGPTGSFKLHLDPKRRAVFIAGGIGITPIHSIVRETFLTNSPHSLVVLYSSKTLDEAVLLRELKEIAQRAKNLKVVHSLTHENIPGAEHGRIDAEIISRYVPQINEANFYISGRWKMALDIRPILNSLGVDDDYIQTDEFAGY